MQRSEDALRQQLQPRHRAVGQILGGGGGDAVLLLIAPIPLHLARRDGRQLLRQRTEGHLPYRQYLEAVVADHADIELAALDVLLHQGVGMGLLVNELDSLLELPLVRDDRGLRDSERGVLGGGLHEQRKAQALRRARRLAARKHHELRRRHAMIGEQLLREHLVARQQHAARIASGVGLVHQFQKRDDVLIVGDDPVELLQQVEDDVRLPLDDGAPQLRQVVAQPQRHDLVAGVLQVRDDIVFGAPLFDFLLRDARSESGGTSVACTSTRARTFFTARPSHSATRGNWRSS